MGLEGGESGDLGAAAGSRVAVLRLVNADWAECRAEDGRVGLVPAAFLHRDVPSHRHSLNPAMLAFLSYSPPRHWHESQVGCTFKESATQSSRAHAKEVRRTATDSAADTDDPYHVQDVRFELNSFVVRHFLN